MFQQDVSKVKSLFSQPIKGKCCCLYKDTFMKVKYFFFRKAWRLPILCLFKNDKNIFSQKCSYVFLFA